jgi:nucleotide-binding universal stress UspA family protein
MLERILVGFDGSAHARRACELATEIAGRFRSNLTLVVVRSPRGPGVDPALENLVPVADEGRAFASVLEEVREKAFNRGASAVEVVYLRGDPLESLLSWLTSHPQDLVVVGSRGLSRGRRLLLGSISSGLVNEAPCPVLVVRGHHGARSHADGTRASSAEPAGPGA